MQATDCLNCGEILRGRFCGACGQRDDAGHHSLRHLGAELVEAFTHADSRLWRTLRGLAIRPGRLTRDFLAGKRAAQIPPLRLFLVTLLVLFGIDSLFGTGHFHMKAIDADDHQQALKAVTSIKLPEYPWLQDWLRRHLALALDHPNAVIDTMREWAERFTLLMMPAAAILLWALFAFSHRPDGSRYTLFDHSVFALHSLSATGLVLAAQSLLRLVILHSDALVLVLPVHLFVHLRGAYGCGVLATLVRMAALFAGSVLVALLLLTGLAALGLQFGARTG